MRMRGTMEAGFMLLSLMVLMMVMENAGATEDLGTGKTNEFCERETFEAACGENEAILMTSAQYGRMRKGRCVRTSYGALGCSVNVLRSVDMWCSGKRECSFLVSELHSTKPCPNELIAYLEASFKCVPVIPCSTGSCEPGKFLKLNVENGYLSNAMTSSSSCGSQHCPWVLEPKSGQRYNITAYNFLLPSHQQVLSKYCHRFASVLDKSTQVSKDVTICGEEPRIKYIVTSPSAAVEIKIFARLDDKEPGIGFLLHYTVVGCPDRSPPDGGHVRREGDSLTVTCEGSTRAWHLQCSGTTWVGQIGTCHDKAHVQAWSLGEALEGAGSTPEGLLMVVGVGVAMGVILGFTMLAVAIVCLRKRRRNQDCKRRDDLVSQTAESDKTYSTKVYGFESGGSMGTDNTFYRTYDTRGSLGGGNNNRTAPGTQQRALPAPDAGTFPVPAYHHGNLSSDGTLRGRDHIYESPHFAMKDRIGPDIQNVADRIIVPS